MIILQDEETERFEKKKKTSEQSLSSLQNYALKQRYLFC